MEESRDPSSVLEPDTTKRFRRLVEIEFRGNDHSLRETKLRNLSRRGKDEENSGRVQKGEIQGF